MVGVFSVIFDFSSANAVGETNGEAKNGDAVEEKNGDQVQRLL